MYGFNLLKSPFPFDKHSGNEAEHILHSFFSFDSSVQDLKVLKTRCLRCMYKSYHGQIKKISPRLQSFRNAFENAFKNVNGQKYPSHFLKFFKKSRSDIPILTSKQVAVIPYFKL